MSYSYFPFDFDCVLNFDFKLELNCKVAHLALAWVASKPSTSTVILGASKPEQVVDNLKALEVLPKLTPEVLEKIEEILGNKPKSWVSDRAFFRAAYRFAPDSVVGGGLWAWWERWEGCACSRSRAGLRVLRVLKR